MPTRRILQISGLSRGCEGAGDRVSQREADVELRASRPLKHRTEHPTMPPAASKRRSWQGHVAPPEPLCAGAIKPSQLHGGATPVSADGTEQGCHHSSAHRRSGEGLASERPPAA